MSCWLLQQLAKFSCNCSGQQQLGALLVVWPRGTATITCHHSSNELETRAKTPWLFLAIFRREWQPSWSWALGTKMTECRDQFACLNPGSSGQALLIPSVQAHIFSSLSFKSTCKSLKLWYSNESKTSSILSSEACPLCGQFSSY